MTNLGFKIACGVIAVFVATNVAMANFLPQQHAYNSGDQTIILANANCSAKARAVASSYQNAQILSVERQGNRCVIVLKIHGQGGYPPRVITKTVSG